ncbi:CMD-domain-containing protein [Phellopilus nigrolimitatus]|nr:CMD-domain-containing protein [Phellopilus nigrolimitatus]
MPTTEEVRKFLYDEGEKQRRKVLGDAHVDRSMSKNISDFARAGQELATESAWGTIWTRPGITHQQRSLVSVVILSTLGKQQELAAHVKGALNNGLTEGELKQNCLDISLTFCVFREVFLQIMAYTGVPNGMEAFRTADAAIQTWKAENS